MNTVKYALGKRKLCCLNVKYAQKTSTMVSTESVNYADKANIWSNKITVINFIHNLDVNFMCHIKALKIITHPLILIQS